MKKDYRVNATKLTKPLRQAWKYYRPLLEKAFLGRWGNQITVSRYSIIHAHGLKHIEMPGVSEEDRKKIIKSLTDKDIFNFDMFFPMPPYHALMLGGKIRRFLCKLVAGSKGTVDIRPYIRPDLDEKLGILIEYRIL